MTGQVSSAQLLKVLLQAGDTVVFNNNASSIGLFDRRTAMVGRQARRFVRKERRLDKGCLMPRRTQPAGARSSR